MKKLFFLMTCLFASVTMFAAALGEGYTKVTNIATLAAGDKVVLYCDDTSEGVTGVNGTKDAAVSTVESEWLQYVVEECSNGVYLNAGGDTYIASPGTSNQFKHGATAGVCSVNADGVLTCNNRFLVKNSNYYRMYESIGSYKPFYVYKVAPVDPTAPSLTPDMVSVDFGSIDEGSAFESKTVHVTGANLKEAPDAIVLGTESVFGVTVSNATVDGCDLTITCSATAVGQYTDDLFIQAGTAECTIPLSAEIKEALIIPTDAVVDTLVYTDLAATSGSYATFQDVVDNSIGLGVVYAGKTAAGQNSIQFNSSDNDKGIITTASKAYAKQIKIVWNDYSNKSRAVQIFGSKTAFTAVGDLYADAFNSETTFIAECAIADGLEQIITFPAEHDYQYIGIRSKSSALYIDKIIVVWQPLPPVEATKVELNQTSAQLAAYRTLQLTATLTPEEATTAVKWESSNEDIATVSATGLVTAGGSAGTITITATAGEGVEATCEIEVSAPTVLTPSEAALLCASLSNGQTLADGPYVVEGYVVSTSYSTQYKNLDAQLSDTKDGNSQLGVYRGVPIDEDNIPTAGAKVRVVGELTKADGNARFAQNSSVIVLEAGVVVEDKGLVTVEAFLEAKDDVNIYTLTGVVQNIVDDSNGRFDLVDETGSIYIYNLLDADGQRCFESKGLAKGDTVTLKGSYAEYNGDPQIKDAVYVSHTKCIPKEMGLVTIAEFLTAKDDINIYTLKGVVSNIVMDVNYPDVYNKYGNFDLVDKTGSLYIYGLLDADSVRANFISLGVDEGDTLILKGSYTEYKGAAQISSALYVSHVDYVAPLEFDYNYGVAPAGWKTAQDMYDDLITLLTPYVTVDGTHTIAPLAEVISINGEGSLPWWSKAIDMNVLKDEHFSVQFGWLATYLDATWTAQAAKYQPTAGSANFRYSLSAFFLNTIYTGWPQSPDFTTCGVSSDAWQPYFDFYTAPTREGYDFLGWFDNADANGTPFSFAELPTTGKVYAGWKQNSGTTALENVNGEVNVIKVIENGQVVIIRDGVRYNVLGAKL